MALSYRLVYLCGFEGVTLDKFLEEHPVPVDAKL